MCVACWTIIINLREKGFIWKILLLLYKKSLHRAQSQVLELSLKPGIKINVSTSFIVSNWIIQFKSPKILFSKKKKCKHWDLSLELKSLWTSKKLITFAFWDKSLKPSSRFCRMNFNPSINSVTQASQLLPWLNTLKISFSPWWVSKYCSLIYVCSPAVVWLQWIDLWSWEIMQKKSILESRRVSVEKSSSSLWNISKRKKELVKVISSPMFRGIALCHEKHLQVIIVSHHMINAQMKRQKAKWLGCMSKVHFPLTLLLKKCFFHCKLLLFSRMWALLYHSHHHYKN